MRYPRSLDPDLLRAFVFVVEEGSFTRAAERVGRTQSAVSMQIQKLETLLGQRLIARGRGEAVSLTSRGRALLARAREMLALNDAIWGTFCVPEVAGVVKLGAPDDYAWRYLPPVLARFADAYPAVEVEVACAPSDELAQQLETGDLDLSLLSEGCDLADRTAVSLWRGPLLWLTSERHATHRADPLPLAIGGRNCAWARAAMRSLDAAHRAYRVAYTSRSQAGTLTPVLAGLAVTVSLAGLLPEGVVALEPGTILPTLPDFSVLMLKGDHPSAPCEALAAYIEDGFRQEAAEAARQMGRFARAA